uniref:Uncharacterized protein n=1 Tax=Norrisiella sphaerica TaxID=552664 RepID=A0A7S2QRY0_9EUKA|mmetsp:Transcript_1493/g.2051  ORF Transcript_1493/g.2051 Transcript_1493/m.2051 type:complete len:123 (+) Transcript_1493:167-535(+)
MYIKLKESLVRPAFYSNGHDLLSPQFFELLRGNFLDFLLRRECKSGLPIAPLIARGEGLYSMSRSILVLIASNLVLVSTFKQEGMRSCENLFILHFLTRTLSGPLLFLLVTGKASSSSCKIC